MLLLFVYPYFYKHTKFVSFVFTTLFSFFFFFYINKFCLKKKFSSCLKCLSFLHWYWDDQWCILSLSLTTLLFLPARPKSSQQLLITNPPSWSKSMRAMKQNLLPCNCSRVAISSCKYIELINTSGVFLLWMLWVNMMLQYNQSLLEMKNSHSNNKRYLTSVSYQRTEGVHPNDALFYAR